MAVEVVVVVCICPTDPPPTCQPPPTHTTHTSTNQLGAGSPVKCYQARIRSRFRLLLRSSPTSFPSLPAPCRHSGSQSRLPQAHKSPATTPTKAPSRSVRPHPCPCPLEPHELRAHALLSHVISLPPLGLYLPHQLPTDFRTPLQPPHTSTNQLGAPSPRKCPPVASKFRPSAVPAPAPQTQKLDGAAPTGSYWTPLSPNRLPTDFPTPSNPHTPAPTS